MKVSSDDTGTGKYALATGRKKIDAEQALGVIPDTDDSGRGVPPVPTRMSTDDARWGDVDMDRYLGWGVFGIHAPPPQKP